MADMNNCIKERWIRMYWGNYVLRNFTVSVLHLLYLWRLNREGQNLRDMGESKDKYKISLEK